MSAITAIVRGDGRPVEAEAHSMIGAMAARAPDGIHVWSDGPVGLGHGALHTTREAARERLPLERGAGSLVITADARIDNRGELVREFGAEKTVGDAELILMAYDRWRESCPERLEGDFAFAIWDAPKQALFCACDRFAVKPLYWHRSPQLFVASTEIKGLLAVEEVPRRLNEGRLADFLTVHLEDPVSTIYLDISRLPAAHALTIDRNRARLRRYWYPGSERGTDLSTDADYEQAFRDALTQAVEARLRSLQPVTFTLSGGLDSSSIVVLARQLLRSTDGLPVHTISACFSIIRAADEREYIDAVLELGELQPHFVFPENSGPLEDWEGAAWRGDEPELVPQRGIASALFGSAANLGSNCLMLGEGGDDVVSPGIERLTELAGTGRWITLVREAHALAGRSETSTGRLLRRYAVSPFIPDRLRAARQRFRTRENATHDWAEGVPIQPEFVREAELEKRYEADARFPWLLRHPTQLHAESVNSAETPLMLSIRDRLSSLAGVEPRYPFLDRRMVDLCVSAPPAQKLRNGYTRNLLRRSLDGLLPAKVRLRTDKGLPGEYIAHALPATGREVMDRVILAEPNAIAAYVDVARLREQYLRCLEGAGSGEWYPVWRAIVACLWLERANRQFGLTTGANSD
jgi:asparagine synthase (glutamine-hydrolysing)